MSGSIHNPAAQATASGGEVASLKSSASQAASTASSSRPNRRMIIECRQLACATMLIEPRRLASASTVSQIRPATSNSPVQMSTSSAYTAPMESGEMRSRAGRVIAPPSADVAASSASLITQAADRPVRRGRVTDSATVSALIMAFWNSSAWRLSARSSGTAPASAFRQMAAASAW